MNERVEKRLEQVVWNQRRVTQKPDIKPDGKNWLMDTMPFNAVCKEKINDDYPLQYLCEGKYISFKPVDDLPSVGLLSQDKRSVSYRNALGVGISIELHTSQAHWRKLIRIDRLQALGDITGKEFAEFKFEVETDFDIPQRENKKPRIKLGENSFIEVSQAWDSAPEVINEETGETTRNETVVRSFFKRENGKLYFIKQIPTEWLKTAIFPVYTDTDISWGTASEFGTPDCVWNQCCEIDTNKFVVASYRNFGPGEARVGTVSGTTITWGTANEFCADIAMGLGLGVCKLDTNKFVVVYADYDQGDRGYARVGTVSGTTITWGTAVYFDFGKDAEYPSCCQLGTDKFAIAYDDEDGVTDYGAVLVCTVSDSTITVGTPLDFYNGRIGFVRCCKLDTDKFVVFYRDYGDGSKAKACAFTVSGTTPTAGTIKEIDSNGTNYHDCIQLDTDKFLIAWQDYTNTISKVEICTVSGTTITEGAEVEFNDATSWHIGLAKIDGTHFVITYGDDGNEDKGTSRYCSFSGTTITLNGAEIFHDAKTSDTDVCLLSADKIVVVYKDDADVDDVGEAIIGDKYVPPPYTPENKSAHMAAKMMAAVLILTTSGTGMLGVHWKGRPTNLSVSTQPSGV